MFGIQQPVKFKCEEGLNQILYLTQHAQKYAKIVEDNTDLNYLIEQTDFLEVCKLAKSRNVQVYVMTEQSNLLSRLQDADINVFIAPKRSKYHFVSNGEELLLQKRHREDAQPSKKPWLYCKSDFFGEPEKHNDRFDNWAKKCERMLQ
jgi:hypothetical protein